MCSYPNNLGNLRRMMLFMNNVSSYDTRESLERVQARHAAPIELHGERCAAPVARQRLAAMQKFADGANVSTIMVRTSRLQALQSDGVGADCGLARRKCDPVSVGE
jgi:hypothetical protein